MACLDLGLHQGSRSTGEDSSVRIGPSFLVLGSRIMRRVLHAPRF